MLENRHSFDWINIKIMDHETKHTKINYMRDQGY